MSAAPMVLQPLVVLPYRAACEVQHLWEAVARAVGSPDIPGEFLVAQYLIECMVGAAGCTVAAGIRSAKEEEGDCLLASVYTPPPPPRMPALSLAFL
jgi:hypothetical protein